MSKLYKQEVQRVEGIKKVSIYITDSSHAELLLKLRYDDLTQKKFFKLMIESYLLDDKDFKEFFNKKLEEKLSVRKKKNKLKDTQEQEIIERDFALNEDEIENIFDIIEKENPDL